MKKNKSNEEAINDERDEKIKAGEKERKQKTKATARKKNSKNK